jgi:hypothetical protein
VLIPWKEIQVLESTNEGELFRRLAQLYAEFGRTVGIEISPFREDCLPLFSKLPPDRQRAINDAIARGLRIFESVTTQGKSLGDSTSLVWAALKELGLRPPSDLFGHITDESIVEVHSPDGAQLFRSFTFYRYCSYSLEDLYCASWFELYERDDRVMGVLMDFGKKIFVDRSIKSTVALDVPNHIVRELHSPRRYNIEIAMNWVAPLFGEGTSVPAASVVVETARRL